MRDEVAPAASQKTLAVLGGVPTVTPGLGKTAKGPFQHSRRRSDWNYRSGSPVPTGLQQLSKPSAVAGRRPAAFY